MIKKMMMTLIVALYVFCSCQDENSILGESLLKSSFRNVFTDTCTVDISTILMDSIETLGDSVCQVGHYKDSVLGDVLASYYAEFNKAGFTPDGESTYIYDSITLTFTHSGHYWGDTLVSQHINVYPLAHSFNLVSGETLYNHSKISLASTPLFWFSFMPRPGIGKTVEVRMPDYFGRSLFNDMMAESDVFDSQEKFREYFHGLALVPEKNGNCVTGMMVSDSSIYIKMYYHVSNSSLTEQEVVFTVNTDYAYTFVEHDRTSTTLAALETGVLYATSSSQTGKRAFLQGLTGLYNAIEFPYLNNLQVEGDIVSIESAMLYLYPARGTYGVTNQLPISLRLYTADENNNAQDQIYDSSGTTIQDGSLTVDEVYGRDTYYSFDLTSFMQDNLGTWGTKRQKLFLILDNDDFVCTFDQVTFGNDATQEHGQIKLEIRYKTYEK